MEFLLDNEDGIQFPAIRPSFKIGDRYFDRFCTLIPRDNDTSILGQGGAGVVHLAKDEVMDRLVALKLLNKELQNDPMARLDVIRETSQAMDLTHPNIVRIHDFHEGPEGWGISMQYIDGLDLDKWRIENSSGSSSIIPYPVERIENWTRQLCDALTYAHDDARMVHRDIKPRNLMLEQGDHGVEKLYLTDFGITKKLATHILMVSRVQPSARDEKSALGTLPYMSWQQLEDELPTIYDDIYSVGATIYDLITGRPPFYEGSYDQIRDQIKEASPPSMDDRLKAFALPNPGIPDVWEEVVRDCLLKDPKNRPSSVQEISERLGLSHAAPIVINDDFSGREKELERQIAEMEAISIEATAEKEAQIQALTVEQERQIAEMEAISIETTAEKEAQIQALTVEQERQIAEMEAISIETTAEKEAQIQALTVELDQLRESITNDGSQSESLKAELGITQQTIAERETEIASLGKQLEEARKIAQLEGDEALTALQETVRQNEAEITSLKKSSDQDQATLNKTITNLQTAVQEREDEIKILIKTSGSEYKTLSKSIQQKDEELIALKTTRDNQKAALEKSQKTAADSQSKLSDLETKLQTSLAENSQAAGKIQEAQSSLALARQQQENEVAKARQTAEKATSRLKQLKEKQAASLVPLLAILIASLVLGLGGGALLGKFSAKNKNDKTDFSINVDDHLSEIPTEFNEPGALISTGLFRQFSLDSGVLEDDLDLLIPDFSSLDDHEAIQGVTYPMTESFCAWLTSQDPLGVITEGSRAYYRVAREKEASSLADETFPEWTSTPYSEGNVTDAKVIINKESPSNNWLVRTWRKTLSNGKPLTFRVVLDKG